MNVRELIEELNRFDHDSTVEVEVEQGHGAGRVVGTYNDGGYSDGKKLVTITSIQ